MKAASNPEWMPKNPYPEYVAAECVYEDWLEEDGRKERFCKDLKRTGFDEGCRQTASKIFVWLNSDCIEPHSEGFDRTHKDCKFCMQQFCKEVRL